MPAWKWLNSLPPHLSIRPPEAPVEAIRQQLLALLDDCTGFECDRLRWRLHTAECAQDLWLLRSAIYQVIAGQHCQAQAQDRINTVVPAFQRALPQALVTRV